MAKKRKSGGSDHSIRRDKTVRRVIRTYWILGVIVVLSIIASMGIYGGIYTQTSVQMVSSVQTVQTFQVLQDDFDDVNKSVLEIIVLLDKSKNPDINQKERERTQDKIDDANRRITSDFTEIDTLIQNTMDLHAGDSQNAMQEGFTAAVEQIDAYRQIVNETRESLGEMSTKEGMELYREQLEPVQQKAAEMIQTTIANGEETSRKNSVRANKIRTVVQVILTAVLIGIIVLVVVIAKRQIASVIEIRQKEQEITEAGNRLTKSRKKLLDSAMTNILTGMKNRYALDEGLSQLIGNTQFNIAVFDIDNFRMINDMYSYEFGDEYLATIAEMLRAEFSEYADMYNITGNEFCAVFYDHVSDLQAQQLAEQIRQAIGQPLMVAGIPVQTTVSSSLYRYLPSDNLEVNTLLMKMDSALHAAKRDGGNRLYQIQ